MVKDIKAAHSVAADVNSPKTKISQITEDNVQIFNHAVKTTEMNTITDTTILKMQLKLSEKEIASLQGELRASTLKSKTLEEQLFNAEQKMQSMQDKLITTNEKTISLEEALRVSGEAMQSLRKSLQDRDVEASTAREQLKLLEKHNLEHQETIKKMTSSHGASENLYRKRLPEVEAGLKSYKMQVDFLQDTLRGVEITHKEEMEELTNEMEKQTMHLQYLQGQGEI